MLGGRKGRTKGGRKWERCRKRKGDIEGDIGRSRLKGRKCGTTKGGKDVGME